MTNRPPFQVEREHLRMRTGQHFGGFNGYDSYCNPITIVLPAGGGRHA